MRILIKTAGEYEEREERDLIEWFKENTDDEGNVEKEIVVFTDVVFKLEPADSSIRWTLSDYSLDRDLERIDPAGWELKNFKKNPIVLWMHDLFRPAIGKILSPKVKDGKLIGRVQFSSADIDPFAGMIEGKVREGIISAGSVGFKPSKVEIPDGKKKEEARLIHRKQELYEFSIGNLPSNLNAMAERMTSGYMRVEGEPVNEGYTYTTAATDFKFDEPNEFEDRVEAELAGLHARIADLEKANVKSKSYIGDLLEFDRESSGPSQSESSDEMKFDEPNKQGDIEWMK